MKNEMFLDALEVQELSFNEIKSTDGGIWGFLAGLIVMEIVQGVYQAHQKDFRCTHW